MTCDLDASTPRKSSSWNTLKTIFLYWLLIELECHLGPLSTYQDQMVIDLTKTREEVCIRKVLCQCGTTAHFVCHYMYELLPIGHHYSVLNFKQNLSNMDPPSVWL